MWWLSDSQKLQQQQQQNILCDFLFFEDTYRSLSSLSNSLMFWQVTWCTVRAPGSWACVWLESISISVLSSTSPLEIHSFFCLFIFLCFPFFRSSSETCRNNAQKQQSSCKIQVFHLGTAQHFFKNRLQKCILNLFILVHSNREKGRRH